MNTVHIHLILNHIPILVTILSIPIVIWGYYRGNRSMLRLGMLGFVIAGLTVIPVFLSGEGAHDYVETSTVSELFLNEHEEAADVSLWLTGLLGVVGLGGLIIEKRRSGFFHIYIATLLMISLVTAGFLTYTGYLGGNIRHTEIQSELIPQKAQAIHYDTNENNY